ncbi:hypothetical protein CLOP_g1791 [Closterium sp. NIES-67]|nr:hypothetical protein CLOP_g1791 [Closterium sp. NIES-67]
MVGDSVVVYHQPGPRLLGVNQQRDQRHGLLSRGYTLLQQRRWLWFWSGKWRHFELTKANRWRKECRNSSTC